MKISLMALVAGFGLVVGLPLAAMAGPTPGGANSDSDSVANAFDNCTSVANPEQKDLDHDGCGDLCDGDFNQDGATGVPDFGIFKASYGKGTGQPGYDARADLNCDGVVGVPDFGIFKAEYGGTPGPSSIPASHKYAYCSGASPTPGSACTVDANCTPGVCIKACQPNP
jgi:hypothetical protein